MSTQLQEAQSELAADLRSEINWFLPSGERHFVNPATISTVAAVFMGMFFTGVLDGLKDALKGEGKKAGKYLGDQIVKRVRAVISDKEEVDPAQVGKAAEEAKATIKAADRTQAVLVFDEVEAELSTALQEIMPERRAVKIATRVRLASFKVVYDT